TAGAVQPCRLSQSQFAERSQRIANAAPGHPACRWTVARGATSGGWSMVRSAPSAACLAVAVTADSARRLATLLLDAGQSGTVVFTGAGVSTESGTPDL